MQLAGADPEHIGKRHTEVGKIRQQADLRIK